MFLSVGHVGELYNNNSTDRDAILGAYSCGPRNHHVLDGIETPHEKWQFFGSCPATGSRCCSARSKREFHRHCRYATKGIIKYSI